MNLSDLRGAPETAGDVASASLRAVSDVSLPDISLSDVSFPDVSLPDALDIDIADLASDAIELASDMAGAVVTHGGRGLAEAIRAARRNPKAAVTVVAVLVIVLGLLAAKKKSKSDATLDAVS